MELNGVVDPLMQFGPLVAVIGVLLRSNANKDKIISDLTSQALQMVQETRRVAELTKPETD